MFLPGYVALFIVGCHLCSCEINVPEFAPPAADNDTTTIQLRAIAQATKHLQPKQNRDGGYSGGEMGSLLMYILRLQAIIQALSAASATPATTPTTPTTATTPSTPTTTLAPGAPTPAPTSATTTTTKPAAPPPPPAASPPAGPSLQHLMAIIALTGGLGGGMGGGGSDDPSELARGIVDNDKKCYPTGSLCDPHTTVQKILAFPDHILIVGDEYVFKADRHGVILDGTGEPKLSAYGHLGGNPTSTMRIGDLYYTFYDDHKTEAFDKNGTRISSKVDTTSVFFGVKNLVKGAFRFNDHTLAIFFEKYFIFYQPLVNPPVDPRFSPQPISVVPGGPATIEGAVEIDGKRYLYDVDTLYEIASDEMKVVSEVPIRRSGNEGWIQCDSHCN